MLNFVWKKEEVISAVVRDSALDSDKPLRHNVTAGLESAILLSLGLHFLIYRMEIILPVSQNFRKCQLK